MSSTATKEKKDTKDERPEDGGKGTLPVGHPQAGYTSPDLSFQDGTGILPEAEKAWHELRDKVQEEGVTAVAEHENEVAEELAEATEEADKQAQAARDAQVKKQVDAGLIAAPTPSAGAIVAEKQAGSKSSS